MIKIKHACALKDENFTISYERIDGRFKPIPDAPGAKPTLKGGFQSMLRRESAAVERPASINLAELDRPPCPGCRDTVWIICGDCQAHVCGALSPKGSFMCRKSCGAFGSTTPAMTCDAVDGSGGRRAALGGPANKQIGAPVKRLR
ncbi:hypothetical protein [Rhodopila sp.]|uniref:hypothetical protein n=1 Tax=Rhodopila sp. TaxID=2480087 RepID=UPI003D10B8A5